MFAFSESLVKGAISLMCGFRLISFEYLCDFVMDMFGSHGRMRVHSTEALDNLRFMNSRLGCFARVTTLCRATEALLEDENNVEEASK